MNDLPLAGVTVVSIEQAVAAPFASRQLADLGARVIKIERPPGGDFARYYDETVLGQSSFFVWLNRSKESVLLDLKSRGGREAVRRLIVEADVVLENLVPGAMARLGFDVNELLSEHPALICCSISGYGQTGSASRRRAYDLHIQCESGLVSLTGTSKEVAKAGISIADIAAGMYTFSSICAALYRRSVTGRGASIDVSMFECLMEWMAQPVYFTNYGFSQPGRIGVAHPTIAPYGAFATSDGANVVLAVQNEREWRSLCENVLCRPDLAIDERFATNSARVRHRDTIDEILRARLHNLDVDSAIELLTAAGIATGRLNDVSDAASHTALVERGRWTHVDTPGGRVERVATSGGS